MAKTAKKSSSRVVSGSTKKSKKPMKLTGRTILFALVGVLAFSILAGMGWQKWQDHQLQAKAYNWVVIANNGSLVARICHIPGTGAGRSGSYYKYYSNYSNYNAYDQYGYLVRAHSNSPVLNQSWGSWTLSNGRTSISGYNNTYVDC